MKATSKRYIHDLIKRYPKLVSNESQISKTVELLTGCFSSNHKLLVCGNGGSAADALHIVGELMKSFTHKRFLSKCIREKLVDSKHGSLFIEKLEMPLPAIALVEETSLSTAFINDVDPALVYSQQILGYGNAGDVLLAISTSGNSQNVIFASEVAKALGLQVIGLTGKTGGALKELADLCINVDEVETYKVQELHLPVYHAICLAVENEFFGDAK
ncbi:MAG: SIS domain-containing protein [Acidaminococcus sp.]|jgi:D-sedoheptulose 7-phosphate isomerase|nr:SIS domain-containing protein [Acidaminococcus sp.]MCI2116450.1 SIS domain-containing protein [Acidaminococcus sp.]